MSILYNTDLLEELKDKNLLLDTSALIDAVYNREFRKMLTDISQKGCSLLILPSVRYEFTRTAKQKSELEKEINLLKALKIQEIDIHNLAKTSEAQEFLFNFNNCANRASYTDSQLCLCSFLFKNSSPIKILTSNFRDIPLKLFKRDNLIVFDDSNKISTEAIYSCK